jgi:energy-coupling factor transporter ATP-binding protein EcfA2
MPKQPIIITIAGPKGAGKTTLAAAITALLRSKGAAVRLPRDEDEQEVAAYIADGFGGVDWSFDVTIIQIGMQWGGDTRDLARKVAAATVQNGMTDGYPMPPHGVYLTLAQRAEATFRALETLGYEITPKAGAKQ